MALLPLVSQVRALAIGGNALVTAGGARDAADSDVGAIRMWDIRVWRQAAAACACGAEGALVGSGVESAVRSPSLVRIFDGEHNGRIVALAIDGRGLLVSGDTYGALRLWCQPTAGSFSPHFSSPSAPNVYQT